MAQGQILDQKTRKQIVQIISHILADTYILYVKTQSFHWNLVDPRFYSLHVLFQEQYEELAEAIDILAERIRMLDFIAPGSLAEFLKLGCLKEAKSELSGDEMLQQLADNHMTLAKHTAKDIDHLIKLGDQGSGDLLIDRLKVHEKAAWMLRSHLTN